VGGGEARRAHEAKRSGIAPEHGVVEVDGRRLRRVPHLDLEPDALVVDDRAVAHDQVGRIAAEHHGAARRSQVVVDATVDQTQGIAGTNRRAEAGLAAVPGELTGLDRHIGIL
jgi:hypothetical protein